MMRTALRVVMLAVCLVALECTAVPSKCVHYNKTHHPPNCKGFGLYEVNTTLISTTKTTKPPATEPVAPTKTTTTTTPKPAARKPAEETSASTTTTATVDPKDSPNTSKNPTDALVEGNSNAHVIPLQKVSSAMQSLHNKDGSIGSSLLFSLAAVAMLIVMTVTPAL